jgi:predicted small secreted protein
MKKLLMGILVLFLVLLLSGCSTAYGTGKVIYKGAKTAYIELDLEDENLERIDNIFVVYDKVRTSVVEEVQRKKQVASILKVQEP